MNEVGKMVNTKGWVWRGFKVSGGIGAAHRGRGNGHPCP